MARSPRGPGRMRGPGRGAARRGRGAAYLVRRPRRHRTRSSRAAARARPAGLRSGCSQGSSGKRPMPAVTSSAVRCARPRWVSCSVSPSGAARRRLCSPRGFWAARPRSGPSGCPPSALPGMSRRGPRSLGPQVPDSPPPAQPPPTRAALLPARLLENGAGRGASEGEGVGISREPAS